MSSTYAKEGPLAVGAIISASWQTFRKFLRHWLALGLPVFLVVDLIGAIALSESNATARGIWAVAGILASIVGALLLQGALTLAAEDVTDGRVDLTAEKTFEQARTRLPALFGTILLVILFFVAGIVGVALIGTLLSGTLGGVLAAVVIVIAVVVGVRLSVLAPVVVLERKSGRAAIERAWEISQGHWFLLLRVVLLSAIIVGVPARIVGSIISAAIPGFAGNYIDSALPDAFAAPLPALALVLTYFRLTQATAASDEPPVLPPLASHEPPDSA